MSPKPLTEKEFGSQMENISRIEDDEVRHIEMDNLMCHQLLALGYEDAVKIFCTTPKWWA